MVSAAEGSLTLTRGVSPATSETDFCSPACEKQRKQLFTPELDCADATCPKLAPVALTPGGGW